VSVEEPGTPPDEPRPGGYGQARPGGAPEPAPSERLAKVMAEIDDEVRRRRAAGDFPPSFERRLDLIFSRFTPVAVHDTHFEETLKLADRSAYVDIEVPVLSQRRGVGALKKVLRRLMAWYLNYVVQQITHFTSATMRVLHMVDERLRELEAEAEANRPAALGDADLPQSAPDLSPWLGPVRSRLSGARGRVLHADCGEGVLVQALTEAGVDAYGVDPRASLLDRAAASGADVRCEHALEHLRAVSDLGLGGLVLSECVDHLGVRHKRELVRLAQAKLAPGASLVVLGTGPNHWSSGRSVLESDLAPGRPLHPETWAHLLEQAGFASVEVELGPAAGGLERVPGPGEAAAAANANFERLNEALFGPVSYSVSGVRAEARRE
jgi:2-polyprenyl-3-methyl-5-hydroxy-6-metoxy-1,4-benzoquinol methylase